MHYCEVTLHANDNQDENRGRVAQRVYKLVHATQELTENPAENRKALSVELIIVYGRKFRPFKSHPAFGSPQSVGS